MSERRTAWVLASATLLMSLIWWLGLSQLSNALGPLDRLSYDILQRFRPLATLDDFQIIEMDQKSYRELKQDPEQLWDRSLHAQLLRKLTDDQVRIVVFDIFFSAQANEKKDQDLAEAMRRNRNVGIVVDVQQRTRGGAAGVEPIFPVEPFRSAAAVCGLVGVNPDPDGVVRRHMEETELLESLAWGMADRAGAHLAGINRLEPRWLRYYGTSREAVPKMSYADALEQDPGFFRGKSVFVGGGPLIKKPGEQTDTFPTPFSRWNGEQVFGVEILATQFANLLRAHWLTRLPALAELMLVLLAGLGIAVGCSRLRPLASAGLAAGAALCMFGLAWVLQTSVGLWFSWLPWAGVITPGIWLASVGIHRRAAGPGPALAEEIKPSQPTEVTETTSAADQPQMTRATLPVVAEHCLLKCVGRGAYGEVWLARNAVGILHAAKIIHQQAFENIEPFEREFRGISKFMPISRSHPGFVHILQVGRNDQAGYFYYVMEAGDDENTGSSITPELYSPKNLFRELRRRGRLTFLECIDLGIRLADALAHLHQQQLIHRDIKPANIIFVQGTPKLADIGLVTTAAEDPNDVTYLGTRGYISPEGPGTAASDIYALGKVLYETWTGLDREEFPNVPTALLSQRNPAFNLLNQILLKACETDPKDRYQSAADMHRDLLALRTRESG